MAISELEQEITKRRTFAIISHPDAGKTTLTEKLLLYGGAINLAGTVKGRKAKRAVLSDWMALERERGISVTTSVMQFMYQENIFNLLDTPGHEDFSEDTYRTLTAVDSALMVIDAGKGVESRTVKLMEICRQRGMPIITFINKLDRESRSPLDLQDEIEQVLNIKTTPLTFPFGSGKSLRGIYDVLSSKIHLYTAGSGDKLQYAEQYDLGEQLLKQKIDPAELLEFQEELDFALGVCHSFDVAKYQQGLLTPVFYGSALQNFGIAELLQAFVNFAPYPKPRASDVRDVLPSENNFSGFIFKIQANMDANHHDRIAFLRICSGKYEKGMRVRHLRLNKELKINSALNFIANKRDNIDHAYPGDIIGIHNYGTLKVGDTLTTGEVFKFKGIPHFAPELFKICRIQDPLKLKALQKGLLQLAEEGAVQIFKPLTNNRLILGAIGNLQFDIVQHRLLHEYQAHCYYEEILLYTVRWVMGKKIDIEAFKNQEISRLALDNYDNLVYLAPNNVNLSITIERWPNLQFISYLDL